MWWVAETGVVLVLNVLISLVIVNIIFIFVRSRWWIRGIFESVIFVPFYFMIAHLMSFVTQFDYSNLYIMIFILFTPTIITNLIFNKLFPIERNIAFEVLKQDFDRLEKT